MDIFDILTMCDVLLSLVLIIFVWSNTFVTSLDLSLVSNMDSYIDKQRTVTGEEPDLFLGRNLSSAHSHNSRILIYFNLEKFKPEIYAHFNKSETETFIENFRVDNAVLTLHCTDIHISGNANQMNKNNPNFSGNNIYTNFRVYKSSLLKPWNENEVTWIARDKLHNWTKPYIDTLGVDSKYPENFTDVLFENNVTTCKGINLDVELTDEVSRWLEDPHSNRGVLLWTANQVLSSVLIGLGSREQTDEQLIPRLNLTISERRQNDCLSTQAVKCELPDAPGKEICLPKTKVCNFHKDCVNGQDELICGYACDFEGGSSCQGWQTNKASDGRPGFVLSRGLSKTGGGISDHGSNDHRPTEDASGNPLGHYLLFENINHTEGATADVIAPWYGSSGPQCSIQFYVNMYGRSLGGLRLLIHTEKAVGEIWSQETQLGIRWKYVEVPIGNISEPFAFIFKVRRGHGDEGHIAIDRVTLHGCDQDAPNREPCALQEFRCGTGVCVPRAVVCDLKIDCYPGKEDENPAICGELPENAMCTFESGWCGWFNYSTEYHPWHRHHGQTPTSDTGPSTDHTLQSEEGHYLYMESTLMGGLQKARVASPQFEPPPPQTYDRGSPYYQSCQLRFFYHMYGHHIYSMSVSLLEILPGCDRCSAISSLYFGTNLSKCTACHKNHTDIWKKSKSNTSPNVEEWIPVRIPLPEIHHRFIIIVEGIPGLRTLQADIGLDDVSLSPECFYKGIMQNAAPSSLKSHSINKATNLIETFHMTPHLRKSVKRPRRRSPDKKWSEEK